MIISKFNEESENVFVIEGGSSLYIIHIEDDKVVFEPETDHGGYEFKMPKADGYRLLMLLRSLANSNSIPAMEFIQMFVSNVKEAEDLK